ncbi:MAG: FAD-binding protein, partial [Acidobacteria bacterium]|nr:FAD-binding protein [Acidobacteriota bacterium]
MRDQCNPGQNPDPVKSSLGFGLVFLLALVTSLKLAPGVATGEIERWDEEADVVILGSGLAGCVTAIEAYETNRSAKILIVEKMPEHYAGGSSRVSGGALFIPQDLEALLTYRRALDEPNPVPEDVVRT